MRPARWWLFLSLATAACGGDETPGSEGGAGKSGTAGIAGAGAGRSGGMSGHAGTSGAAGGRAGTTSSGGDGGDRAGRGGGGGTEVVPSGAAGAAAGETDAGEGGALGGAGSGSGGNGGQGAGSGDGGAGGSSAGSVSYSTDFDVSESPLSENGAWHHVGLDWTIVETAGGIAYGTQALGVPRSGPEGYNDSYARLSGFPPNQQASAVVALGTIDTSCTHEVEIILRWADSDHDARGYECNVAYDGSYAQIVRWNGPVGDYTYLANGNVPGGMHDGDTVSASVVGSHITLAVNGIERANADDETFADGNPGVAFWRGSSGCGTFGDYGFTSFAASSVTPSTSMRPQ